MNGARRLTLIAASVTLICFFLPWIQVDITGARGGASGLDLARDTRTLLWLVPSLSLTVLLLGMVRIVWERASMLFALSGTAGGCIIAYLMYVERAGDTREAIIPVEWTVWYWLGLAASLIIATAAFVFYARQTRSQ